MHQAPAAQLAQLRQALMPAEDFNRTSWKTNYQPQLGKAQGRPVEIAFPCAGALAGLQGLKDQDIYCRPKMMYDTCEAVRSPIMKMLATMPWVDLSEVKCGDIIGDVMLIDETTLEVPDGVATGPPCISWAGPGGRDPENNPHSAIFWKVCDIIITLGNRGMKFFAIENVRGIKKRYRGETQSMLVKVMDYLQDGLGLSWTIQYWELNTIDFDLPHHRDRIYIVGAANWVLREANMTLPSSIPPQYKTVQPHYTLKDYLDVSPPTRYDDLNSYQQLAYTAYKAKLAPNLADSSMLGKIAIFDLTRNPERKFGAYGFRSDGNVSTLTTINTYLFAMSLGEGANAAERTVHRCLSKNDRARLQGLPTYLFSDLTDKDAAKATGNAFSVPVMGGVLHYMTHMLMRADIITTSPGCRTFEEQLATGGGLARSDAESSSGASGAATGIRLSSMRPPARIS